jgi:hypothetical protein
MTSAVAAADVHLFAVPDAIRWKGGAGHWAAHYGGFSNTPMGASIYYFLKEKRKDEVRIEIFDSSNRLVKTLSSVPRPSDRSGDQDDTEDLKKAALPVDAGVHRAEWNLTWEGAKKIEGAKIDFGDPSDGPRATPGAYTVRLTAGGKTLNAPLRVVADPRGAEPQGDLDAQLAFSLRVRDTISKLAEMVHSMRSVREQLAARAKALAPRKTETGVADLLKAGEALTAKVDALEARLHNPKAEITYDILAQRGGARLYSRLSPLQMWAVMGDGAPTAGMKQVLAEYETEMAPLERDVQALMSKDVADINARARALNLEFVIR